MAKSVSICKFVGTISLGLLTGVSYTLSTLTLPSLLTLPTASTAHQTFAHLRRLSTLHTRLLTSLACASLSLAFIISPARGRHPYLLWTSAVAALGSGLDLVAGGRRSDEEKMRALEDGEVNGEEVRQQVERTRKVEGGKALLTGAAFAMGVVGIWGDGV